MAFPPRKRHLLVLFAFIALTAAVLGWIGVQRHQNYKMMAQHHLAEMAAFDSSSRSDGHLADMFEGKAPREQIVTFISPVENTKGLRASEAQKARRAAFHADLSRKYREAADRPWIAIEFAPPSF